MTTVCMFKNGMWPALNYLLAWLPEKILIWGAARPRLQVGLHDQAGAGRHPQVRHGGALQR